MSQTSKETPPLQDLPGKSVSEDTILKTTKEIVVKFIEVGRLSPANFEETFKSIYDAVRSTIRS
ncbi:MAG: conjugal transfer protein TraB [Pseudomonadota bacterium]